MLSLQYCVEGGRGEVRGRFALQIAESFYACIPPAHLHAHI